MSLEPTRANNEQLHKEVNAAAQEIGQFTTQKPALYERKKYLIVETQPDGTKILKCRTLNLKEIWDAKKNPDKAQAKLACVVEYLSGLQGRLQTSSMNYSNKISLTVVLNATQDPLATLVTEFLKKQIKSEKMNNQDVNSITRLVDCLQPGQLEKSKENLIQLIHLMGKHGRHDAAFTLLQKLPEQYWDGVLNTQKQGFLELFQRCAAEPALIRKMCSSLKADARSNLLSAIPKMASGEARVKLLKNCMADSTLYKELQPLLVKALSDDSSFVADFAQALAGVGHNRENISWYLFERATGPNKVQGLTEVIQSNSKIKQNVLEALYNHILKNCDKIDTNFIHQYSPFIEQFNDDQRYKMLTAIINNHQTNNVVKLITLFYSNQPLTDRQLMEIGSLLHTVNQVRDASPSRSPYGQEPPLNGVKELLITEFPVAKLSLMVFFSSAYIAVAKAIIERGDKDEIQAVIKDLPQLRMDVRAAVSKVIIKRKDTPEIQAILNDLQSILDTIDYFRKLHLHHTYDTQALQLIIATLNLSEKKKIAQQLATEATMAQEKYIYMREHYGNKETFFLHDTEASFLQGLEKTHRVAEEFARLFI